MNSTLQSNLEELKKIQPDLYGQILPLVEDFERMCLSPPLDDRQHIEDTVTAILRHGNPQILFWLGLNDLRLIEAYDKRPHAQNKSELVIVTSPIPLLSYLSREGAPINSLFRKETRRWLFATSLEDFHLKLSVAIMDPLFGPFLQNRIILKPNDKPELVAFQKTIEQVIQFRERATNNLPIDSYYGYKNMIGNLQPVLKFPFTKKFKDGFKDKPGILIGAGPSLDKILPYLKGLEKKAVLFSVDSALRVLLKNGIHPHLTGCLERVGGTIKHFDALPAHRTTLVTTPVINKDVYPFFGERVCHIIRGHHFIPWLLDEEPTSIGAASSVTHLGLLVLAEWGCNPIYMVGQDLAYDPYTRATHTQGYWGKQDVSTFEERGYHPVDVPSNKGGMITTTPGWVDFAQGITSLLPMIGKDVFNVIPKDYGMKITGVPWMDPVAFQGIFSGRQNLPIDPFAELEKLQDPTLPDSRKQIASKKIRETLAWLEETKTLARKTLKTLYEFEASAKKVPFDAKLAQGYRQVFKRIEHIAASLYNDDLNSNFLDHGTMPRLVQLEKRSEALMGDKLEDRETCQLRLCIGIDWLAEILIRSEMMGRKLKDVDL